MRNFSLSVVLFFALSLTGCGSHSTHSVDSTDWIPVRNGQLYLEVKGKRTDAPLLLWLHGGPGGAERPMFRLFNGELEDDFRVAYLDQRGAGRSFDPDASTRHLTVAQHLEDLERVILRLKANKPDAKVTLVGHSWGAELAILYAYEHARDVDAVIAVNPLISEARKQDSQFATLGAAARQDNRQAADLVRRLGPPPWSAGEEAQVEKAIGELGGIWFNKPNFIATLVKAVLLGLVRPNEIGTFIEANRRSLEAMNDELLQLDLRDRVKELDVPVVVLIGAHDRQAPPAHAAEFLKGLSATKKLMIRFENSAHNIPFEEPSAFNACLAEATDRLATSRRLSAAEDKCPYEIVTY
jgi:pimeloyl-ACP methyl ester carboxylesterase